MNRTIGITGGIGAGKSVVSRVLRLRGYGVYDCDWRAKILMDNDKELLREMQLRFGEDVTDESGKIDRKSVARHIFGDEEKRRWLNSVVHKAVREDFLKWRAEDGRNRFIESAILAAGELLQFCDEVWVVTASKEERVKRIIARSGLTAAEALSRMESQREEEAKVVNSGIPLVEIIN